MTPRCANGSDANPCPNRPEYTYRMADDYTGRWLGVVCGACATWLIAHGQATLSTTNRNRIVYREQGGGR